MESEKTKEKKYYQTYKIKSNKENFYDIEIFINEKKELVFYTTKIEEKIKIEFINNFTFETLNKIKIFSIYENIYEIFDSINEIIDYRILKNNPPFIEENTNLLILQIPNKNISFEIKKKEKSDSEIIENLISKINDLEFSDKNKEKKNDILNIVDEIKNRLNKKNKEIDELKNNINKKKENENNENENNKNIEIILNNKQNNQTNTTKLILPNSNPMNKLLKTLIENNYINTQKVLNCMLQVDRKDFTNTNPYKDQPQYVSHKASISAPHMHAFALEKLSPFLTEGINVLDIGSGTGYL